MKHEKLYKLCLSIDFKMNSFDIFSLFVLLSSTSGVDIVEVPFHPRVKGTIFVLHAVCVCMTHSERIMLQQGGWKLLNYREL